MPEGLISNKYTKENEFYEQHIQLNKMATQMLPMKACSIYKGKTFLVNAEVLIGYTNDRDGYQVTRPGIWVCARRGQAKKYERKTDSDKRKDEEEE